MDPARWQQIERLYHAALARPASERTAFLVEACRGDDALRQDVQALLDAPPTAEGLFARPAVAAAAPARSETASSGRVDSERSTLVGRRLGVYQLQARVGAGGMGEVYRARDTRLGRDVAIKMLPRAFTSDPDRLARFEREARVLAALNHPNIATIHGLEEVDGIRGLVMELVEGETLAERIARGPIPFPDALDIARQIADALEAAHERGIVHRDLKPGNVMLRPDGGVKVLDFGLAKALGPKREDAGSSVTVTVDAQTEVGVLMGTPAYMSPEQASGQGVDKRADIWAFGCVLYEMCTGRRAFDGSSTTDTLSRVLTAEPSWTSLPADTPPLIRRLLKRCLDRDPHRRLRDIGEARLVLEDSDEDAGHEDGEAATRRVERRAAAVVAGAVVGVLIGGLGMWWWAGRDETAPSVVTRTSILLRDGQSFSFPGRRYLAVSPAGTHIAFTADPGLWIRNLAEDAARRVPGIQPDPRNPFFSPDGQLVGYYASGFLWQVSLSGGAPTRIVEAVNPWSASWTTDGTILYGQGPDGIWRVPAEGGAAERVINVAAGESAHAPQLLPGGEWVLFTLLGTNEGSWDRARIVVQSLSTGERDTLVEGGRDARYVSAGYLLYGLNGDLLAAPFDSDERRLLGPATEVLSGVVDAPAGTGAVQFDVSTTGTLVYAPQTTDGMNTNLVLVDRRGNETLVSDMTRAYRHPRLSPDGERVAVAVEDTDDTDVWIGDLQRKTFSPLTLAPGVDDNPVWTADGTGVTLWSARGPGLFLQPADAGAPRKEVIADPDAVPSAWTRDGILISDKLAGPDIFLHAIRHNGAPRPLRLIDDANYYANKSPALSPDNRFIAYHSIESGAFGIYVRPFPDVNGGRWQISTDSGVNPAWSPDGGELYFMGSGTPRLNITTRQPDGYMMAVHVDMRSGFEASTPERLFRLRDYVFPSFVARQYDVASDGRFLMLKDVTPSGERVAQQIRVVQNWFQELQRLVPTR